jgi:predicted dithiol-disulfide oxidoreductase (DUF899 family)
MTDHKTATREQWPAARLELLEAEKEFTRQRDELTRRQMAMPWERVEKSYQFELSRQQWFMAATGRNPGIDGAVKRDT